MGVISNEHVLSINKQWAGEAGRLLKKSNTTFQRVAGTGWTCEVRTAYDFPSWVVLSKRLARPAGAVAVLIINIAETPQTISVSHAELVAAGGHHGDSLVGVDVWNKESVGLVKAGSP